MSHYPHAAFLTSADKPGQFLPDTGREVAFAGRSNAGKSSAINVIVARRNLARTSKTPGRTQLINFFALADDQRLVDLPGYGFARVPDRVRDHWRRLMEAYFRERRSLAGLMLIMDCRRPLMDFDVQMLDWAAHMGRPVHILLTKADKLSRGKASATLHAVRRDVDEGVGVQLFSALKGTGVAEARVALDRFLAGGPSAPESRQADEK